MVARGVVRGYESTQNREDLDAVRGYNRTIASELVTGGATPATASATDATATLVPSITLLPLSRVGGSHERH